MFIKEIFCAGKLLSDGESEGNKGLPPNDAVHLAVWQEGDPHEVSTRRMTLHVHGALLDTE